MHQNIKKHIVAKLKEKNMSIAALEREAGLKTNVARNILVNLSKKPSGETLHAIAKVLNCSIDDLLNDRALRNPINHTSLINCDLSVDLAINSNELLQNTFNKVMELQNLYQTNYSFMKINNIVREIYLFSLQFNMRDPDERFTKWIFSNNKITESQ